MKLDKNFQPRASAVDTLQLDGVNAAIIGGTGGIGRALAQQLASRGANVLVIGQTFRDAGVPGIEFLQADLSLMHEAKRVAAALPAETLDLVVFTTGIFAAPTRQETSEGLEKDMAVSYLSRLVIIRDIASRLGTQRPARVFVMGFPGAGNPGTLDDLNAEKSYKARAVHMNTVAGNEMLVLDAAKRYPKLQFFGLNPGLIKTEIRSNFLGAGSVRHRFTEWLIGHLTPSVDSYAKRITPLLLSPDLESHSGTMFDRKARAIQPSPKLTASHTEAFLSASQALLDRAGAGV